MMSETEYVLVATPMATADANGVATTTPIGPAGGERWNVTRYSVNLSTGRGVCTVYRNFVSPSSQIDDTTQGQKRTSENNSIELKSGETIIFQWTSATPGAAATANVSGKRYVSGKRAY